MTDPIFIFKVLSGLIAGGIATYISLENRKVELAENNSNALRLRRIRRVAIFSIIAIWLSLGTSSVLDYVSIKENAEKAEQNRMKELENKEMLKRIQINTLRPSYPLMPVNLQYEVKYNADEEIFSDYTKRIKEVLELEYGRPVDSFNFEVVLSTKSRNWMPNEREKAYGIFAEDWTGFEISNSDSLTLRMLSIPNYAENMMVHLLSDHKYNQTIREITIDFGANVIRKKMLVQNPLISANAESSFSAIDLIGKKFDWSPLVSGQNTVDYEISEFKFIYPYDTDNGRDLFYDYSGDIIIGSRHIGLGSLEELLTTN